MKKSISSQFATVLSMVLFAFATLGSLSLAEAHPSSNYRAKREFFYLKRTGNWFNYIAQKSYLEVSETSFVGLEMASNDRRTCLFGFDQTSVEGGTLIEATTRFFCFNAGQYQLNLVRDWFETSGEGSSGSSTGAAEISIGIGNLDIYEPTLASFPDVDPATFFTSYPAKLTVGIITQDNSVPEPFTDLPHRYIEGKTLGSSPRIGR